MIQPLQKLCKILLGPVVELVSGTCNAHHTMYGFWQCNMESPLIPNRYQRSAAWRHASNTSSRPPSAQAMITCVPLGLCRLVNKPSQYLNWNPGLTNRLVRPASGSGGTGRLSSTRIPLVPIEMMRRSRICGR